MYHSETKERPLQRWYRSFFDYALRNLAKLIYKMLGTKALNYDAYGLFRAVYCHICTPFRSVLNARH